MRIQMTCALLASGLVAAACSDPIGPESERALLSLNYSAAGSLADAGLVTFRLANGGWRTTVPGSTLASQGAGYWQSWVPVASPGRLELEVLLRSVGDTLALARQSFDVQRRWDYVLNVYVARGNPRQWFWECGERVYAFPLLGSSLGADSLYLVWGAQARNGPVC